MPRSLVELTRHWNAKYGPEINFHTMHPGWVDTEGVRISLPGFRRLFGPLLRTPEQGADTAIWLAAERPDPPAEGSWSDREPQPEHLTDATRTDPAMRRQLVAGLESWIRANESGLFLGFRLQDPIHRTEDSGLGNDGFAAAEPPQKGRHGIQSGLSRGGVVLTLAGEGRISRAVRREPPAYPALRAAARGI